MTKLLNVQVCKNPRKLNMQKTCDDLQSLYTKANLTRQNVLSSFAAAGGKNAYCKKILWMGVESSSHS